MSRRLRGIWVRAEQPQDAQLAECAAGLSASGRYWEAGSYVIGEHIIEMLWLPVTGEAFIACIKGAGQVHGVASPEDALGQFFSERTVGSRRL